MAGINIQNWKPTHAQRHKLLAKKSVDLLLRSVLADRVWLLTIVVGGKSEWKRTARKAWRGMPVSDDAIQALWDVFVLEAGNNPKAQLEAAVRADVVKMKTERLARMALFITSERHLDELLSKVENEDERHAIRALLVPMLQKRGVIAGGS